MDSLIFKIKDSDKEFVFENKVYQVEDKKLVQDLRRPNIKNADSLFVIKSLNDLHISDVVQIRINLKETGAFLASFQKDNLSEEKREELLKQISTLKSENEPTSDSQLEKTKKLLEILGDFAPIYVTFVNFGQIKISLDNFSIKSLKFPVLVLKKESKFVLNFSFLKKRKNDVQNEKSSKETPQYAPIELFTLDYLFIGLFALLGSLGIITAIFELMNKQGIGIFLIILSAAFFVTEIIAMTLTIYPKGKLKHPLLRYYLIPFILVGIAIGIVGGYFISSGLLKTEIENFDYKKLILLSTIISIVSLVSSVGLSIPCNIIIQKIQKKKKD